MSPDSNVSSDALSDDIPMSLLENDKGVSPTYSIENGILKLKLRHTVVLFVSPSRPVSRVSLFHFVFLVP